MLKRLLALTVSVLAGIVVCIGVANAYDNTNAQILSPFRCPEYRTGQPIVVSDPNTGGRPLVVKFSWVALQAKQVQDFLDYEYGSISVTDSNGNMVFSQSWPMGDTASWTPIAPVTVPQPNGSSFDGYGTAHESLLGPLSSGPTGDATYYLTIDAELTHAVNDGFGSFPRGKTPAPYVKVTNCAFTVHDFSQG
jgi:hypothetical protein